MLKKSLIIVGSAILVVSITVGVGMDAHNSDRANLIGLESTVVTPETWDSSKLISNQPVFQSKEWENYVALVKPQSVRKSNLVLEVQDMADDILLPWNKEKATEYIDKIKIENEFYENDTVMMMSGYPVTDFELVQAVKTVRAQSEETGKSFDVLVDEWNPLEFESTWKDGEEIPETQYIQSILVNEFDFLSESTSVNKKTTVMTFKKALKELNASKDSFDTAGIHWSDPTVKIATTFNLDDAVMEINPPQPTE